MARMKFEKNKVLVTPAGALVFPWLSRPDTKFVKEGQYRTKIAFDPESSEFKALKAKVDPILKAAVALAKDELTAAKAKKLEINAPFKPEEDEEGEETGRVTLTAKSKAVQEVNGKETKVELTIVDAKRSPIKGKPVYGGSVAKLALRPMPYYMANGNAIGITFYICGVQVLDLVSADGGASFFDEEDGFEVGDSDDTTDAFADDEDDSGADDDTNDDLY